MRSEGTSGNVLSESSAVHGPRKYAGQSGRDTLFLHTLSVQLGCKVLVCLEAWGDVQIIDINGKQLYLFKLSIKQTWEDMVSSNFPLGHRPLKRAAHPSQQVAWICLLAVISNTLEPVPDDKVHDDNHNTAQRDVPEDPGRRQLSKNGYEEKQ